MTDALAPQPKKGAWVLLILFLGLASVGGVMYYKHKRNVEAASKIAASVTAPVEKPLELGACNDKVLVLEKENLLLRSRLKSFEEPMSVKAPTSAQPGKKQVVVMKKPTQPAQQPQPAKDTTHAPQSSWNGTPVPGPVLDWLRNDGR